MYFLEIKLPGVPKTRNALSRKHWTFQKKEADLWKNLVRANIKKFPKNPLKKAHLILERYSIRECDYDGLVSSMKHVIDGLVVAQILEDDSMKIIGMPVFRFFKVHSKDQQQTIVKVKQLNYNSQYGLLSRNKRC